MAEIFERRMSKATGNGNPGALRSESDQEIRVRRIGSPVSVKVGGQNYNINPPSFVMIDFIVSMVNKARSAVLEKRRDEGKNENEKTGDVSSEEVEEGNVIKKLIDESMFDAAQLILYNSKHSDWIDRFSDVPPRGELDSVITIDKLRECNPIELDILFEVFRQLSRPELPRNSFLKLGTIL